MVSARSKSRKDNRLKNRLPILFSIFVEDIRESITNYFMNTPSVFAIYFIPDGSTPGRSNNYIYFDDVNMEIYITYSKFSGKSETVFNDVKLEDVPDFDLYSIIDRGIDNVKDIPECMREIKRLEEEYGIPYSDRLLSLAAQYNGERVGWTLRDLFFDDSVEYSFQLFTESYKKFFLSVGWKGKHLNDLKKVYPFSNKVIQYSYSKGYCYYDDRFVYNEDITGDETIHKVSEITLSPFSVWKDNSYIFSVSVEVYVRDKTTSERLKIPINLKCSLETILKNLDSLLR